MVSEDRVFMQYSRRNSILMERDICRRNTGLWDVVGREDLESDQIYLLAM